MNVVIIRAVDHSVWYAKVNKMTTAIDGLAGGGVDLDIADFDLLNLPDDFVARAYEYFAALRANLRFHCSLLR